MNRGLNVAIVGCGRMGLQHARVARAQKEPVRLSALVDASPSAREEAARRFPDVPVFESLGAAIEHVSVAAVHVCTPQDTHVSVAADALRRGCHVLVEKPFTHTLADARKLVDMARAGKLVLCAGHQLLFEPAYRHLVDHLPLVNDVVHVESYFAFAPTRGTPSGRVGLDPEAQLMDILPHPLYLLLDTLARVAPKEKLEICHSRLGEGGTIHAILRRGEVQATLVVTISGRPVESTLRVVGTGGELCADLVRGILRRQIGPGRGAIDKIAAPYVTALQSTLGTTGVLLRRFLRRKRDYPSLDELIMRWYAAILDESNAPPTPEDDILDAVGAFETIVRPAGLGVKTAGAPSRQADDRPLVVVTGGTGWLGQAVTKRLVDDGARVTVISRRSPARWQREEGVDYKVADLAEGVGLADLSHATCVVHCAAETVGGKEAHARNSIRATENLIAAMRKAGIGRLLHVSSLAVVDPEDAPISEDSRLQPDPVSCGPYAWGKVESEKLVMAADDLERRIVRPAAIIDVEAFDPPGKLGRRVGPLYVTVGGRKEVLGVVELDWAARAIAWMALHFEEAPEVLNLFDPVLPTRRQLAARLKASNPTLIMLRMPRPVLWSGGLFLLGLSRLLRPRGKPIDIRKVFARQKCDTRKSSELRKTIAVTSGAATRSEPPLPRSPLDGPVGSRVGSRDRSAATAGLP